MHAEQTVPFRCVDVSLPITHFYADPCRKISIIRALNSSPGSRRWRCSHRSIWTAGRSMSSFSTLHSSLACPSVKSQSTGKKLMAPSCRRWKQRCRWDVIWCGSTCSTRLGFGKSPTRPTGSQSKQGTALPARDKRRIANQIATQNVSKCVVGFFLPSLMFLFFSVCLCSFSF